MLELLAVGEPLGVEMLRRLGADVDVLDRLERLALVQVSTEWPGPRLRLAHPLHGEVLRSQMTSMARMVASRRLAAAHVEETDHDELRLGVWRLEGGGPVDPGLMLAAARQAFFVPDAPLAERLARAALSAGAGLEAGLVLAQILGVSNRHDERHELLVALAREAMTDEQVGMVAMEQSLALFWGLGRPDDALVVLEGAEASMSPGARLDEVTAQRATFLSLTARFAEAVGAAGPLLEADHGTGRAAVTAAIAVAPALAVMGRSDEAIAVADRAFVAHRALGPQEVLSDPGIHVISRLLAMGEAGPLAEAGALAQAGYEAAVAAYIDEGQAWFALMRGRIALVSGGLEEAGGRFREAAAVFADLGQDGPRRWCLAGRALAAAQRGRPEDAVAAVGHLDALDMTPMSIMEPDVLRARAWVQSVQGFTASAVDGLMAAAALAEGSGALSLAVAAWHDLARVGSARAAAPRLAELATAVDGELPRARAAHAGALVGRDAAALAVVVERFESCGAVLFAAEAAAAASAAHRRKGERRAAERWAHQTARLVEQCGGAATPALSLAGPAAALTPREREVGALAATGLSSKEIASRLGLSARTVDTHLQQVYVKLGVSGRSELADALGAEARL